MVKKSKNIRNIIIFAILIVISGLVATQFNITGGEDYLTNEKYKTIDNHVDLKFTLQPTPSYSEINIYDYGYEYNKIHNLETWGFDYQVEAIDSIVYDGDTYAMGKYVINYNGETKEIYNRKGVHERLIDGKYKTFKEINFYNGNWVIWKRDITESYSDKSTWKKIDLDWEVNADFNEQFKITATDKCRDKSVDSSKGFNICGESILEVDFNPDIEVTDVDIERLLTETDFDKTVVTINNNFNDFKGLIRYLVSFETAEGKSDVFKIDKEVVIKKGTHEYFIDSALFLLSATKLEIEVYNLEYEYLLPIGTESNSGVRSLINTDYMSSFQDENEDLRATTSLRTNSIKLFKSFFVKYKLLSYEDEGASQIFAELDLELKQKIEQVKILKGNIDAQAQKIIEISDNLEQSAEIINSLELTLEDYMQMISILTQKNEELAQYLKLIEENYEDKLEILEGLNELLNLEIEDDARILNLMNVSLSEYKIALDKADYDNEQLIRFTAELELKASELEELVESYTKDLDEARDLIKRINQEKSNLEKEKQKAQNLNMILIGISIVLIIIIIILIRRKKK